MFARLFILCVFFSSFGLEIFVTKGTLRPIVFSLAISDVSGNGGEFADQMREIAVADLMNSGMFVVKPADQSAKQVFTRFDMEAMRSKEIKIYVGCVVEKCDEAACIIRLRIIHDTGDDPETVDIRLNCKMDDLRLLSHQVANAIYQIAWSIPGDFDSKIVYVNKTGGSNTLVLIDRDGSNSQILDQGSIISTPSVSKDGNRIAYAKHVNHYYCLFIYDRRTGQKIQLTQPGKICYAPVFSNDGSFIVFSMSANGSTSLCKMDLATKKVISLTHAKGWIDTTPAFTASGTELIMISDRKAGTPKPYVYGLGRDTIKEIKTTSGAYYDPSCCINPYNNTVTQVCFFKRKGGMAYLGMLLLDSGFNTIQERLLWQGPRLFSPSWGINGTSIVFSTNKQIKRINIFTGAVEVLTSFGTPNTPVVATRPLWEQKVATRVM